MKMPPFLHGQHGQGTIEWIIALPALLLLLGGIIQIALVFTTRSTLDWATFYGVREATLDHGSLRALRTGLAKGLMPLYPGGRNPGAAQTAQAYASASTAAMNPAQVNIQVLNPTPGVIRAWTSTVNKDGQNVSEIPNSRLIYAATGPRAGETLQAANLFKARVRYCYPLMVPFVNTAIKALMTGPFAPPSAWDTACYQSGGLPIAATATELMQSALYPQALQNPGAPATTPPGGTQNGRGGGTPVGQQHGSGGGTVESCKVSTLPYWSTHWPTSNP